VTSLVRDEDEEEVGVDGSSAMDVDTADTKGGDGGADMKRASLKRRIIDSDEEDDE
jgi:hypothetical protein